MHKYQVLEKGKPLAEAKKAIILLHGRGADAEDIISLADEFCDETFYIAAPQATNNAWYPYSFLSPESSNEPWLTSAVQTVKRLLEEITVYVPAGNIYISGFSQGACLTLEVAARYAIRYAGIIAFSGGLIGESIRTEKYRGNFEGTKVFIGNSDKDPHIPLIRSQESGNIMKQMGADVTMKVYPDMQHTIILDEIETVKKMMF
jgi:phospholipase/carboxylesterase